MQETGDSVGVVLVYGGNGALGAQCVAKFKSHRYTVVSIDAGDNLEADFNIAVDINEELSGQENSIMQTLRSLLGPDASLDAVVCVAGGWTGGNAEKELAMKSELLWRHCVWPSLISAHAAVKHLKEGGLVALTGARVALEATPSMIGYGLAKAAVHQLARSLAGSGSGLPPHSHALAILPVILDTPVNRQSMPTADFSTWTSLQFVADLLLGWTQGKARPASGSLLQLITKNFSTDVIPV